MTRCAHPQTQQILQAFDCTDVELSTADGTTASTTASYLTADFSISCSSGVYKRARVYAIIMAFVYPVGVPLLYTLALLLNHRKLNPFPSDTKRSALAREQDRSIQKYQFLWGSYR
jgi:hypothetical protein